MYRAVAFAFALSAFAIPAALAVDFSRATCDYPELAKTARTNLVNGKATNGQTLRSQGFEIDSFSMGDLRHRSRDKLICSFRAELTGFGNRQSLRGQVIFENFGNGMVGSRFSFGY